MSKHKRAKMIGPGGKVIEIGEKALRGNNTLAQEGWRVLNEPKPEARQRRKVEPQTSTSDADQA